VKGIVTGAARGLGEGIAARLVSDGWDVTLIDRDPAIVTAAERLRADAVRGGGATGVEGDVADPRWVESEVPGVIDRLGGLTLLVNNAGIGGPSTAVVDTAVDEFRRVLDVNLVGTFLMAKACIPSLIASGGGAIVNLGSIFGQQGVANGAAYCASKGGVALLTHSLALELAPHGVRVNTIAPGNMLTEMHLDDLRVSADERGVPLDDEVERVRATVPLARHGTADDVAGAVAWLASPDAAYVTGQTIGVNGGVILT
jgi:NAD(P)-dependent dehydrogenase (short-subunit alcohol dehydrogenase family)